MGGMMAPVYLILAAIATLLLIPLVVGGIAVITKIGNALGLGT